MHDYIESVNYEFVHKGYYSYTVNFTFNTITVSKFINFFLKYCLKQKLNEPFKKILHIRN